ncbi:MAG: tyrosine-type recombinase/integrase [Janthinobacterium lividum]
MGIKFTERAIERLSCPDGKRDCLVFDLEQRGLVVRVVAAGSKSYLVQYVIAGRKRRLPLGSVDAISLAAARDAARAVMGQVATGVDPAAARKAAVESARVEALRERMTLAQVVGDWERLHLAHRSARYRKDATEAMERALKPWWSRPAERLERRDVVAVVDKLTPSVARALAAYGRACFTWAQKRGSVPDNPFTALPVSSSNVQRDRVLTDAEATKVWKAAAAGSTPYGPIVRLLLLTGQRRDEVRGMEWSELSDDLATWTVPGQRTKNGQPSVVPLSAPAQAILLERLKAVREQRGGLVFPGEGGKVPFGNWSKSKIELDKKSGVIGWRVHDLRRTVATGLQRLGSRLEVTEAVLNHVSGSRGGIVGIYQRHDWKMEKRAALDAWAAHLLAAMDGVQGSLKVVPMRRGRRAAA